MADICKAGHRIPLIVRWPNTLSVVVTVIRPFALPASLRHVLTSLMFRWTNDAAQDSCSFVPGLAGEAYVRSSPVVHHSVNGTFAICGGKCKLVLSDGSGGRQNQKGKPFQDTYSLFDISTDIEETTNLACRHPETVKVLQAKCSSCKGSKIPDDQRR